MMKARFSSSEASEAYVRAALRGCQGLAAAEADRGALGGPCDWLGSQLEPKNSLKWPKIDMEMALEVENRHGNRRFMRSREGVCYNKAR